MTKSLLVFTVLSLCCTPGLAVRNSTGTSFAVAFSATASDSTDGECLIYISALQTTDVSISTFIRDTTYTVNARSTLKLEFNCALFRLVEDTENKVLYIEASDEVSVALSNTRSNDDMEMNLALPKYNGTNEYHIMSHATTDKRECTQFSTTSFFNILAYEDNTQVIIYNRLTILNITLNRYEAYTVRSILAGIDHTGVKVVSDKAVSVTSGNACSDLNSSDNGVIWTSIPTSVELGTTYISPAILHWQWHKYKLRVLALSDSTTVTLQFSGIETVINAEEFIEWIVTPYITEVITCSKKCQVVQYGFETSVPFMTILPSTDQYVKQAQFSNSNDNMIKLAHVILLSDDVAAAGITIDGRPFGRIETFGQYSLLHENWNDDRVSDEWHIIESNVPFSVLMYGVISEAANKGYGYNAAFLSKGPEEPDTNSTTPDKQPQYEISMTGQFYSSSGEDFSQKCTVDYGLAMNDRTLQMIPQVNNLIGSQLCAQHTTEQMKLIFASTVFHTDSNTGETKLWFVMEVDASVLSPAMVEGCAAEIADYLLDHSNWTDPILSPIAGCPEVLFTSGFFNDSDSVWICDDSLKNDQSKHAVLAPTPRLSLIHSGLFSTADGSDITFDCSAGYGESFQESTFVQFERVNAMLGSGEMCGDSGGLAVDSQSTNVISQANVGTTFQDYLFLPGSDTTSAQLYACVDAVSTFLQPHSEWQAPIIEAPGGCPALVFDPEFFTENGQNWVCFS